MHALSIYARFPWRGAGVVERDGLENRCTLTSTQGSNPCLSAIEIPDIQKTPSAFAECPRLICR